jgi:hypothetical protein
VHQRVGVGESAFGCAHRRFDQVGDDFSSDLVGVEPFEDLGGCFDGERFDVVCFENYLGEVTVRYWLEGAGLLMMRVLFDNDVEGGNFSLSINTTG